VHACEIFSKDAKREKAALDKITMIEAKNVNPGTALP
jgi:hypothetical protein